MPGTGNKDIAKLDKNAQPPRHLADMRRVYESDDAENDTAAQRPLRLMKLDNYERFLSELNRFEREFKDDVRKNRADRRAAEKMTREKKSLKAAADRESRAARQAKEKADALVEVVKKGPDPGTMCALELIEKLLREAK